MTDIARTTDSGEPSRDSWLPMGVFPGSGIWELEFVIPLGLRPRRVRTNASRTPSSVWCLLLASILTILLSGLGANSAEPDGLGRGDRDELLGYARTTWRSVAEMADGCELPADALRHHSDGTWKPSLMTTPTDIGCYMWSVLAAERLKIIRANEAERRLAEVLRALGSLERVHGFYYDKIDPRTGVALRSYPEDGKPISPIASSVDNGWLAAALIMVRNSFPTLRERADALLEPMDFGFFYVPYNPADPKNHPGQMQGSYHIDRKTFGGFHQIINTEQRIFSYIGIARGQIPAEHYYRMRRTLKPGELEQRQTPTGTIRTYFGIPVFEGHYTYRGNRIVPSWGGSMFESLDGPALRARGAVGASELGRQPPALRPGSDRARLEGGPIRLLGVLPRLQSRWRVPNLRRGCPRLRSRGLHVQQ